MAADPTKPNAFKKELEEIKQKSQSKSLKLCQTLLSYAMQDRKVQHVINSLRVHGCNINESFFQCKPCDNNQKQGFQNEIHPIKSSTIPHILLCSNNEFIMKDLDTFKQYLLHELLLTFDYCRVNIDYNNCLDIACTEIRASRLSGECGPYGIMAQSQIEEEMNGDNNANTTFLGIRSKHSIAGIGLRCIRKQAALNIDAFANCQSKDGSGKIAWESINTAWTSCFRDIEPFKDRIDAW